MIKIDLRPDEFVILYDLLSMQLLNSGELVLPDLRSRMKEIFVSCLKEKEDLKFERWEREQRDKMEKVK